jgi:hypothetical protein
MDEEGNRLRNDSMGTNYTFRDKHGNLVMSSDAGHGTEADQEGLQDRTTDVPGLNFDFGK